MVGWPKQILIQRVEFNHWSRIKTTHYWQPTFNWTIFVCKTLLCMVMSSILGQGIPIYILLSDIAAEGKIFRSFVRYLNSSNPKQKALPLLFMSHVYFAYPIILIGCAVQSSTTHWEPPSVQTGFRLTASVHTQLAQVGGFYLIIFF